MKIGSEDRNKTIAATVLLVIALLFVGHWLFGPSTGGPSAAVPSRTPAASVGSAPARPRAPAVAKTARRAARSFDLALRYDWLQESEGTEYQGQGRNIFRADVDVPQPVQTVRDEAKADQGPAPPPPPPPINLKFYGFASKPGEAKRIFLSQGEDLFIAAEGDIVDRRYRVLRISPVSVEVEDVLNNNRQSLPLAQGS